MRSTRVIIFGEPSRWQFNFLSSLSKSWTILLPQYFLLHLKKWSVFLDFPHNNKLVKLKYSYYGSEATDNSTTHEIPLPLHIFSVRSLFLLYHQSISQTFYVQLLCTKVFFKLFSNFRSTFYFLAEDYRCKSCVYRMLVKSTNF